MLELLNRMPVFIDTNLRSVDMEVYKEADKCHRSSLKLYITRDVDITNRGKYIWRVGYAYSGIPELSQLSISNPCLEVALDRLLVLIKK